MIHRFPRYLGLAIVLAITAPFVSADPTITVRDITMLAGQSFQMPLDGFDPDGSPLTFAVVSISDPGVSGAITSGNRSLELMVTGQDALTNDFSGALVFELFEDLAPFTTARIIELVESGFYDGLIFHRIINNFVAQGGDPLGNGTGGSGVKFDDEFNVEATFTGFGQLAMANSGDDTNDSQFFITDVDLTLADAGGPLEPPRYLNFNHTIFGQLTSGFDLFDKLINTPTDPSDRPSLTNVTIVSAMVDTNHEDAVLRLSAPTNFTGNATVTVSATSTNGAVTEASFEVTVIPNNRNERPFLGPLPDLVTTQNVSTTTIIMTTDLDPDDTLFLSALDPVTRGPVPNVQFGYDPDTMVLTLIPDLNFFGDIDILFGVSDADHPDGDTQLFRLTVLPRPPGPSIDVVLEKGQLFNAVTRLEDRVKVKASLAFNERALDNIFDPLNESFLLYVGDVANGVLIILDPGDPSWKIKNNKFQWKSPKELSAKIKLKIDLNKGTLVFSLKRFDFDGPQENPVFFEIVMGPEVGSDTKPWSLPHVGVRVFP